MTFVSKKQHYNNITKATVPNEIIYDSQLVAVDKDYFYTHIEHEYLFGVPVVSKLSRECWEIKEEVKNE